jgi:hypothetical protein
MDKQSFVVLGKWTTHCVNMGDGGNAENRQLPKNISILTKPNL